MSEEVNNKQVFHGNVGQVAAGDIVNFHQQPYIDPEFSRLCPECHRPNQLHAQVCWACALDLVMYDRREWRRHITRRAVVTAALGFGLVLLGQHVATGNLSLVFFAVGLFMAAAAASTLKDLN